MKRDAGTTPLRVARPLPHLRFNQLVTPGVSSCHHKKNVGILRWLPSAIGPVILPTVGRGNPSASRKSSKSFQLLFECDPNACTLTTAAAAVRSSASVTAATVR